MNKDNPERSAVIILMNTCMVLILGSSIDEMSEENGT
jgi:hypothetical protein